MKIALPPNAKGLQALRRFIKFGIVGGSGVFVNIGVLYALTEYAHLDYRISSLVAIELAIINNFFGNYLWTWKERRGQRKRDKGFMFVKFNLSSGATALVVNWGLLVLLTEVFGIHYQLSNLIGIAMGTVSNFLLSHFWAFTGHRKEAKT